MAGLAWAAVCLLVAAVSATWTGDALWASLVAVAVMLVLGVVLDAVGRRGLSAEPRAGGRAPGEIRTTRA
ncbi:hypothetical protein P0L94_04160 [Microbacter sp. GSS18]|nr:hypothetical protein P0L94_04160 [Microbacter sp. GSS18]